MVYKAVLMMPPFIHTYEIKGKPKATIGLSLSGDSTTDKSKSLSIYFRLIGFDGDTATYSFYDWREI